MVRHTTSQPPEWTTFDSRVAPVAQRTARWAKMTSEFLVPLNIETFDNPIAGIISGRRSGRVGYCRLSATAHLGKRSQEFASGLGSGHHKIAIALHGRVSVSQYGRKVTLRPGEMTIYSTSDEYSVGSIAPFGVFIALIPDGVLNLGTNRLAEISCAAIPGELSVWARDLLVSSARGTGTLAPALAAVETVLRTAPAWKRATLHSDAHVLELAVDLIEKRIADRRLSPDFLAAVLGVSRRSLYQIFDLEVGPIAGFIRSKRMERARTLLALPDRVDVPISEIALECGFPDQGHFSRLFAKAYHQSPRYFRAAETQL